MASVSGDYDEDWEEAEPSVGKPSIFSVAGELGHSTENDTRDAEPTQVPMSDFPAARNPATLAEPSKLPDENFKSVEKKVKANANAVNDTWVISEEVSTSEDTLSSVEGQKAIAMDPPVVSDDSFKETHFLDLAHIHDRHHNHQVPPPVPSKIPGIEYPNEVKSPSKPDRGALQARVAAKRVAEFRRRQAQKEEELRALESAWTQKRREIRRSNYPMHKELGVADLSAQDHLRIAQRRRKAEAKQEEVAARLERQHRWYNNIPKRTASASDHICELHLQYRQAKHDQQRAIQLKQRSIQLNQLELRQEAHEIIVKNQGAHVHGSYLLKVTHCKMTSQMELPTDKHDESEAGQ
ncbi:hypothetical protein PR003_g20130 [Phytophthora rubi]|uniref:Uncharacterized protein n=1 Tax=Phytophthora rubi TaxID=129364 RepID=A0A6A4DZC4_9STRA|nr:hypothetical protein PR003_g20130 [Phytophthora rubi]